MNWSVLGRMVEVAVSRGNAAATTNRGRVNRTRFEASLAAGFDAGDSFGPVLLELAVAHLEVLHLAGVMKQEVITRAGFKKLLLQGQPGSFVDPHLNLADLIANLLRLGRQLQNDGLFIVEVFFTHDGNQVTLLDVFALGTEAQQDVLVDHLTVFAQVVFLNAVDFRVEDKQAVAGAQNRAWIGLGDIDTHLLVAPHEDVTRFRGCVFHYRGVFDMFEISGKRVEVLCGLVHHAENIFNRPFGLRLMRLCGAWFRQEPGGFARKAAKSCQGKKRQPAPEARPRTKQCCVPHRGSRNPNIYKKMREPAVPFRSAPGMAIGSNFTVNNPSPPFAYGAAGFGLTNRGVRRKC